MRLVWASLRLVWEKRQLLGTYLARTLAKHDGFAVYTGAVAEAYTETIAAAYTGDIAEAYTGAIAEAYKPDKWGNLIWLDECGNFFNYNKSHVS